MSKVLKVKKVENLEGETPLFFDEDQYCSLDYHLAYLSFSAGNPAFFADLSVSVCDSCVYTWVVD